MEANRESRPTVTSYLWMKDEDVNVEEYWANVEAVARNVLRRSKTTVDSWREAIRYVFGLSLRIDRFSDIHPKIQSVIEDHVKELEQSLLRSSEQGNLLKIYHDAWNDYQKDSYCFKELFANYNKAIIRENSVNEDLEVSKQSMKKYLEIEDMIHFAWMRHMLEPIIGDKVTNLLCEIIISNRNDLNGLDMLPTIQEVVQSFEQVGGIEIFEKVFLAKLEELFKSEAKELFKEPSPAGEFMEKVLQQMEKEIEWVNVIKIPQRSIDNLKKLFVKQATFGRRQSLLSSCHQMLKEEQKSELRNLYNIIKLFSQERGLKCLGEVIQNVAHGEVLNAWILKKGIFIEDLMSIHLKYTTLIKEVWCDNFWCNDGLNKALEYDSSTEDFDVTKLKENLSKFIASSSPFKRSTEEFGFANARVSSMFDSLYMLVNENTSDKPGEVPNLMKLSIKEVAKIGRNNQVLISPVGNEMHSSSLFF